MNAAGSLPFRRLEWINDPTPRDAALNMALDEALLNGLGGDALLRIYRWECPAVSIGCFEPLAPVLRDWPRHEPVRRWTGGGVVEHGHDLTFSLLVPRPLPLAMLPAAECYRLIHAAVGAAMARAGQDQATLLDAASPTAKISSACFENPVPHDLLLAGRKVGGGAQRRTRRGLLHQGSIQCPTVAGESRTAAMPFGALSAELPSAFGSCVEPRSLRAAEIDAATSLAATKYRAAAWLHRF